jgi:hypothetical protein
MSALGAKRDIQMNCLFHNIRSAWQIGPTYLDNALTTFSYYQK